jgi:small subunit ribosomal protein S18
VVPTTRPTSRPPMRGRPGKWGGKYAPKRKFCSFCAGKVKCIDYKDTGMLGRFISDRGKIEPRRRTGTCNRHQHALALAIKQARHVALLPFVPEHIHKQGQVPPLNLAPPPPPAVPPVPATPVEVTTEAKAQIQPIQP